MYYISPQMYTANHATFQIQMCTQLQYRFAVISEAPSTHNSSYTSLYSISYPWAMYRVKYRQFIIFLHNPPSNDFLTPLYSLCALYLSNSVSFRLSVYMSLCLSVSVSLCLNPSVPPSLRHSVSLSLCLCVSVCL